MSDAAVRESMRLYATGDRSFENHAAVLRRHQPLGSCVGCGFDPEIHVAYVTSRVEQPPRGAYGWLFADSIHCLQVVAGLVPREQRAWVGGQVYKLKREALEEGEWICVG